MSKHKIQNKSKIQNPKSKIGYRPAWAEVNLSNLEYNFWQIKKMLSERTKMMVCVKADAYGHGLIPVSKKLSSLGVDYLGVASLDEGIKLREAKINSPILILGMIFKKDIKPLFTYKLIPTVCTEEIAIALNKKASLLGKAVDVQIKVDTGMGRVGILYKDAFEFIRKVHRLKAINIKGIFTHFPSADIERNFTLQQIEMFDDLRSKLNKVGIYIPLVHAANSMGVIGYKRAHFNMVRPGLIVYGLYPQEDLDIHLKPLLSLKAQIVYLKRVPQGYGISYGRTYLTKKETTIATLPIGYGDGYPRSLSNQAPVLIGGKRYRISGRVCMDYIMVDVGDAKVKAGDEAVLIGSQGKHKITAEELAGLAGTIPYEIVCGLGSRIPRLYIGTGPKTLK